ncbi:hypothetical protein CGCA056_v008898 [Colletotrichum aenigma]|uniref:uncharacterized protein n=1 Tax=Colletotrichum aenigma TaxID=1215731 RepID=UPI00187299E8|nr:uncharacterized protein CGCA056_v008898 [Colletotrichum aenigma]KAF5520235.1 hypothetical protein CGCA056_v008898 [Colletotrichum aenigma]
MAAPQLRSRRWTRASYLISTDSDLIPIPVLSSFFASKGFYWANPLPEPVMRQTLQNSLCFALYDINSNSVEAAENILRQRAAVNSEDDPDDTTCNLGSECQPTLIGFGRIITDFVTFAFLTDVWIELSTQGQGLGSWLIGCVQEVIESMPHLRRSMLLTSSWEKSVPFYQNLMHMELMNEPDGKRPAVMEMKWKGLVDGWQGI